MSSPRSSRPWSAAQRVFAAAVALLAACAHAQTADGVHAATVTGTPPRDPSLVATMDASVASGAEVLPGVLPEGDPLTERVDRVSDAFRAQGGHPVAERWVTFLREGTASTVTLDVTEARCVGFVAVGRPSLTSVNLAVYNPAGIAIARDAREGAHPYVRVCLTAGSRVYVTASSVHGDGEVAVITLADPPVVPPPLDGILGVRSGGLFVGPRTPRATVGGDPATLPASDALRRVLARLPAPQYMPVGAVQEGVLDNQRTSVRSVDLVAGHCYVIVAAGGPGVDDLDLVVASPERRAMGRDTGTDSRPAVRVCPRRTGAHPVEVRMFSGAGAWALAVAEIVPHGEAMPEDIQGVARARALEVAGEAARRGLEPMGRPVRGAPWDVNTVAFPVQLRAGRCYLAGAAASEAMAPIELWLSSATGAVLASDMVERERALVYHCAQQDSQAMVTVRAPAGRGEFVYQAFESRDEVR